MAMLSLYICALAGCVTSAAGQMGDWSGSPVWTPGSSQDTWWVPNALKDCASNPPFESYHIHVFYRSTNLTSIELAQSLHASFIKAINPQMELCPHPHMDGAPNYSDVCHFPVELDTESMASGHGGFFGIPNYAFFIPRAHKEVSEAWWRQHHQSLDFIAHTNTGCQDPDHTLWATTSSWSGWNIRLIDKSGLICCHTGPAGCRCDITLYSDSTGLTLMSNGLGKPLELLPEAQHTSGARVKTATAINANGFASVVTKGHAAVFRETVYDTRGNARGYSQIEAMGDKHLNIYECIAVEEGACKAGAPVILAKCSEGDASATRLSWVDDGKSGGPGYRVRSGQLASDSCPGFCLSSSNSSAVVLESCSAAGTQGWHRSGTGNKDNLPQGVSDMV